MSANKCQSSRIGHSIPEVPTVRLDKAQVPPSTHAWPIGRQFGMHHTTVLHSIHKVERMRRLDEELNGAIALLMDALQQ